MIKPTMNWSKARSDSASIRSSSDYMYFLGKKNNKEGLHKNCIGCSHIDDKACKFVKFPRERKWPCFFRQTNEEIACME